MRGSDHKTGVCQICGKELPYKDLAHAEMVRPNIVKLIRKDHPQWDSGGYLCVSDLSVYRDRYIQSVVEAETGELTDLEKEVVQSLKSHELVAENANDLYEESRSLGNRVADHMAEFGGSWTFIGIFGGVLVFWIAFNSISLLTKPFDPFPFILLNLVLSCIAAIQAPIIMMSQNRQESRDRLRAENDYQVNLKAELEIRMLDEKVEHLITAQWRRLLEIQQIQTDLMEEIVALKK